MRSLTLMLLCVYYLATCTGIQLHIHFCSSKFDGVTFFEKGECCCDGKPAKMRCCSDQERFIKVSDAHHYSKYKLDGPEWFKIAAFFTIRDFYHSNPSDIRGFISENKDGPPPGYSSDLNILQRVLRI